jgi:hypothetical protein
MLSKRTTTTLLLTTTLPLLALSQSTFTSQETISVFLPGAMAQPYYGSIIAAAPSATTMYIGCAPDTSVDDCGLANGVNYTAFANTAFDAIGTLPGELRATLHCDYDTKTGADCVYTATITQSDPPEPGATTTEAQTGTLPVNTVTTNTTFAPSEVTFQPVTITAGNVRSGLFSSSSTGSGTVTGGSKTSKATGTGTGTSSGAATKTSNAAVKSGQAAFALGVVGILAAVI